MVHTLLHSNTQGLCCFAKACQSVIPMERFAGVTWYEKQVCAGSQTSVVYTCRLRSYPMYLLIMNINAWNSNLELFDYTILKPYYSTGGFEWISSIFFQSAAFPPQSPDIRKQPQTSSKSKGHIEVQQWTTTRGSYVQKTYGDSLGGIPQVVCANIFKILWFQIKQFTI